MYVHGPLTVRVLCVLCVLCTWLWAICMSFKRRVRGRAPADCARARYSSVGVQNRISLAWRRAGDETKRCVQFLKEEKKKRVCACVYQRCALFWYATFLKFLLRLQEEEGAEERKRQQEIDERQAAVGFQPPCWGFNGAFVKHRRYLSLIIKVGENKKTLI